MKSLFSRLRHGRETPPPSRPSSSQSVDKPLPRHPPASRSSSYSGSESIDRSITPIAALHSQSSSASSDSIRPLSVAGIPEEDDEEIGVEGDDTIRVRTISAADVGAVKKVTFRSPVPTPTTSLVLDEIPAVSNVPPPLPSDRDRTVSSSSKHAFPTFPTKKASFTFSRPPSTQSRSNSRQSLPSSMKPIMTRKSSVPSGPPSASPSKSTMSPTPSEHSLSGMSNRSYLPPPNSWSEMAEDDLIANLSPRERTRQEVLWEIVSSEERYVQELIKLKETFCRNLLPPSATSPSLDLLDASTSLARTLSPTLSAQSPSSPAESFNNFLPIAAQYVTGSESSSGQSNPRLNAYNILTNGRPGEGPSRKSSSVNLNGAHGQRSHQSLPPPRRDGGSGGLSITGRMSYHPGAKGKHDYRAVSGSSTTSSTGEVPIPEDLEKVLKVLANGILEGHVKLAAALRRRYENQYPLVRSLADVFTSHSYILREYATYVLHLERALDQVDNALSQYTASLSKRASRRLEETEIGRLGKLMLGLEELAAERGESGLAISLSKPFQRLLKYPLLFQNLLFNTDPSLKEYEATLAMVDEVEEIVRTIEDEKASSEEREKTRDVWARIEGLERDKILMAPKPNRILVNEAQCPMSEAEVKALKDATSKQKKSFRRLSDILKGSAESADLWIVRFSDVSLLCERTGMTSLPVSNFKATRSDSLPDLGGRSRFATTGKRASSVRPRNLYKFIKIHEWHLKQKTGSTEGLLEMEEISRARSAGPTISNASSPRKSHSPLPESAAATPQQPVMVPLKGDGGSSSAKSRPRRRDAETETMVSDRLSVMSFAFKGSDQIKPVAHRTKPVAPSSNTTTGAKAQTTRSFSSSPAIYPQRRSSGGHVTGNAANAKFAHRLRSAETEPANGDITVRPGSRTRKSLPPAMALSGKTGRVTPIGRFSPALSPTERNGNTPRSPAPAPPAKLTPKTPSVAPSTRESVRGLSGATAMAPSTSRMETSVTGTGRRVVPKAVAQAKTQGMRPSASTDSGVAGMWTAYRDGGAVGTPAKKPPPGRSMGGKI